MRAPRWFGWWFRAAALYGAAALLPQYLRAPPMGAETAFYGFVGTALAFQLAFWVIGGDPVRHRPLMLAAVAEKLAFGLPCVLLFAGGRADAATLAAGLVDLVLGAGFLLAWRGTPRER